MAATPATPRREIEKKIARNLGKEDDEIAAALVEAEGELMTALGADHPMAGDKATLHRFLLARKLNVAMAKTMIDEHMAWKTANLPVVPTEAIIDELKKGKFERFGCDIAGRPLIIVHSCKFDPKERELATALAAVTWVIEKAIADLEPGQEKIILFYDRTDFSLRKNWDFEFLKAVVTLLSNNYPERMGGAYLYPAGALLTGLWGMVKPFLEPRTRSKVKIINSSKELLSLVPTQYIPPSSGGTSSHEFDPTVFDGLLQKEIS